jgi:integrase/recombinase XerD
MILAKTGIRRGELHDLKESDLDFYRKTIHIPEKKKRSNYISFMDDEFEHTLKEYLVWGNRKAKTEYLLISNKGGRIHKDRYGMILAELGRELHLHRNDRALEAKLTPHCFRHWFTTNLFRSGMNSQYIKFLRGDSLRDEAWQIYNG